MKQLSIIKIHVSLIRNLLHPHTHRDDVLSTVRRHAARCTAYTGAESMSTRLRYRSARRVCSNIFRPLHARQKTRELRSCLVPRPGEVPETARLRAEGVRECNVIRS